MSVTPDQTAAATRSAVHELGGAFAECPKTLRRARLLGLTGWAFYVARRGGAAGGARPGGVRGRAAPLRPTRAGGEPGGGGRPAGGEGKGGAARGGGGRRSPPYEPLLRRRIRADLITDRIVGEGFRVLDVT